MIIGLTGGIGSGKSTALEVFKTLGFATFSCDDEVSAAYKKRRVLKKLKKVFPQAITGRLRLKADKKLIAKEIFSDKEKYRFLTDLLATAAFTKTYKKAKRCGRDGVIEVPLLLEKDLADKFDAVFIVVRDKKARIKSVIARSNLSEEEVLSRINAQVDYDTFDLSPYIVINNDGTTDELGKQITESIKALRQEKKGV